MNSVQLTVGEIEALVHEVLEANGCDAANAGAVARTVAAAERDGAASHGLLRLPGYVHALRGGHVKGNAQPVIHRLTPALLRVDGDHGFAPLAIERAIPALAEAAHDLGIAAMTIVDSFHFAALWPEVEALAAEGLAGVACVNWSRVMAPHGGSEAIFGTNPLAYAWPRSQGAPVVADMATAAMSRGDLYLAEKAGRCVPEGTGLDADGRPTTDPAQILSGTQLPFGGHKGSAIALLVELLAAAATGEAFSDETADGVAADAPVRGGEFILALCPHVLAGSNADSRTEAFLQRLDAIPGARLPGARRHGERHRAGPRAVDAGLLERIRALL